MISLRRVVIYSLLSIATIAASTMLFCSIPQQKNELAKANNPEKCVAFARIMTSANENIDCPLGFLETQETNSNTILVICHCQDPLRCAEK